MSIRETQVPGNNRGIQFREHDLAHQLLDGLQGLEFGASSHNSFGLAGSLNVAPADDFEFYKGGQVEMNGKYAEIDIDAEADALPVEDSSQDYVISSHVFEHLPNPVATLIEWRRILKDQGIVFMIIPKRDALESDRSRPISTFDELYRAYEENWTVDTVPAEIEAAAGNRRGHYWVLEPDVVKQLVEAVDGDWWELVAEEVSDSKVGNGFTLVYRVHKPALDDPRSQVEDDGNVHVVNTSEGWAVVNTAPEGFAAGGLVEDGAGQAALHRDTVIPRETAEKLGYSSGLGESRSESLIVATDPGYPDAEPTVLQVNEDKSVQPVKPKSSRKPNKKS